MSKNKTKLKKMYRADGTERPNVVRAAKRRMNRSLWRCHLYGIRVIQKEFVNGREQNVRIREALSIVMKGIQA